MSVVWTSRRDNLRKRMWFVFDDHKRVKRNRQRGWRNMKRAPKTKWALVVHRISLLNW